MSKEVSFEKKDGSGLKIGIICARWNSDICQPILNHCKQALLDSQVKENNIHIIDVPGSYELVYGASQLIKNTNIDAVICIGTLIKGETMHFEYISEAVSYGIMKLNVETDTPVIFGVLACLNEQQARERSSGKNSHGYNWGLSAIDMALLRVKK